MGGLLIKSSPSEHPHQGGQSLTSVIRVQEGTDEVRLLVAYSLQVRIEFSTWEKSYITNLLTSVDILKCKGHFTHEPRAVTMTL